MQVLQGTVLQPQSPGECRVIPRAAVRIAADGRIAEVATAGAEARGAVGGEGCWILPGFVDAHAHVPQWDRRGIDGLSLLDWYDKIVYPAEARFRDADFAERLAEDFASGMIANGTTTVAAFGSPFAEAVDRVFGVFAQRGLRAVFGLMLNDADCPDELCQETDRALDEARALGAKWHGAENRRLSYAFCPRAPLCCTEKMMRGASALAGMLKCYVQTHVAESTAQASAFRRTFPDRLDDVDVLAEMGLLTSRTLLGHGVFLSQEQRRQVAVARTAVVHCPTANLFLESGLMDYVAHRSAGIRMALGSGVAGGPDPFMPAAAVQCLQTAKALKVHAIPRRSYKVPSPAEAWWVLTRGGAEALSMEDRIGAIEAGYEADVLVVRPEKWIDELPVDQRISALLYTLRPHQIEHVFVAGRRVGP